MQRIRIIVLDSLHCFWLCCSGERVWSHFILFYPLVIAALPLPATCKEYAQRPCTSTFPDLIFTSDFGNDSLMRKQSHTVKENDKRVRCDFG